MDQQTPQTPNAMPSPQTPIPPTPPSSPEAAEHHGKGPLFGTGIILVLIILGGLYVWYSYLQTPQTNQELPLILGDDREGLLPTSYSDDVNEIEADVNSTDLEEFEAQIDADMQSIESAL